jgi:hypothetical protein
MKKAKAVTRSVLSKKEENRYRAESFVRMIESIPPGCEVTLKVMQGVVWAGIGRVPSKQTFEREIERAVELGFLKKISEGSYIRIGPYNPPQDPNVQQSFEILAMGIEHALNANCV